MKFTNQVNQVAISLRQKNLSKYQKLLETVESVEDLKLSTRDFSWRFSTPRHSQYNSISFESTNSILSAILTCTIEYCTSEETAAEFFEEYTEPLIQAYNTLDVSTKFEIDRTFRDKFSQSSLSLTTLKEIFSKTTSGATEVFQELDMKLAQLSEINLVDRLPANVTETDLSELLSVFPDTMSKCLHVPDLITSDFEFWRKQLDVKSLSKLLILTDLLSTTSEDNLQSFKTSQKDRELFQKLSLHSLYRKYTQSDRWYTQSDRWRLSSEKPYIAEIEEHVKKNLYIIPSSSLTDSSKDTQDFRNAIEFFLQKTQTNPLTEDQIQAILNSDIEATDKLRTMLQQNRLSTEHLELLSDVELATMLNSAIVQQNEQLFKKLLPYTNLDILGIVPAVKESSEATKTPRTLLLQHGKIQDFEKLTDEQFLTNCPEDQKLLQVKALAERIFSIRIPNSLLFETADELYSFFEKFESLPETQQILDQLQRTLVGLNFESLTIDQDSSQQFLEIWGLLLEMPIPEESRKTLLKTYLNTFSEEQRFALEMSSERLSSSSSSSSAFWTLSRLLSNFENDERRKLRELQKSIGLRLGISFLDTRPYLLGKSLFKTSDIEDLVESGAVEVLLASSIPNRELRLDEFDTAIIAYCTTKEKPYSMLQKMNRLELLENSRILKSLFNGNFQSSLTKDRLHSHLHDLHQVAPEVFLKKDKYARNGYQYLIPTNDPELLQEAEKLFQVSPNSPGLLTSSSIGNLNLQGAIQTKSFTVAKYILEQTISEIGPTELHFHLDRLSSNIGYSSREQSFNQRQASETFRILLAELCKTNSLSESIESLQQYQNALRNLNADTFNSVSAETPTQEPEFFRKFENFTQEFSEIINQFLETGSLISTEILRTSDFSTFETLSSECHRLSAAIILHSEELFNQIPTPEFQAMFISQGAIYESRSVGILSQMYTVSTLQAAFKKPTIDITKLSKEKLELLAEMISGLRNQLSKPIEEQSDMAAFCKKCSLTTTFKTFEAELKTLELMLSGQIPYKLAANVTQERENFQKRTSSTPKFSL